MPSFVWPKLTGLFKTSLEETKEFKVIKKQKLKRSETYWKEIKELKFNEV